VAVLFLIGAIPVSILEVESEILDRLTLELLAYQAVNSSSEIGLEIQQPGEVLRFGTPPLEGGRGQLAESLSGRSREEMGAPVHGMDGLSVRAVSGDRGVDSLGGRLQTTGPAGQRFIVECHRL
jgi:hypothetical protein